MKNAIITHIKSPFTLFVLIGFLISLTIFQLLLNWVEVFAVLFAKPDLGYHELSSIIHFIERVLLWVIWVVLIVIFAMDWRKRNFVRTIAYSTGIVLAGLVSFIIFWYQFSATMAEF